MTQRKRRLEERKAQILDAARTLFASRGHDNVTFDDIAGQAEVSRACASIFLEGIWSDRDDSTGD
jgi:AcrR family transcriptional regulator